MFLIPCLFILPYSDQRYGYQDKNNQREVKLSERFRGLDWKLYKRILIVDDSTDTGDDNTEFGGENSVGNNNNGENNVGNNNILVAYNH